MVLGAGGLVLVGVLASAMVLRRDGAKTAETVNVTDSGRAPSPVSPPRDTTRYAGPIESSAATKASATPEGETRPSTAETSEKLDSLETVASGNITAERATSVIRELDQMGGRIKGNEQLVHAAIVRALAEGSRKNNAAACTALRGVQSIAPGTSRAKDVESGITGCP